jgi:hypothetical protein
MTSRRKTKEAEKITFFSAYNRLGDPLPQRDVPSPHEWIQRRR